MHVSLRDDFAKVTGHICMSCEDCIEFVDRDDPPADEPEDDHRCEGCGAPARPGSFHCTTCDRLLEGERLRMEASRD